MAVLALAVQAAAAGRATARPWLPVPDGRRQVPASTARSWRSRFASHAAGLREQVMRLLPAVSGREWARPLVPSGSPAGDCLAALEAVTAGLRERFPALAAVSAHEVAGHLSGGLWLAPPVPVLEFNTSLLNTASVSPP
jgi:hypothetical protein